MLSRFAEIKRIMEMTETEHVLIRSEQIRIRSGETAGFDTNQVFINDLIDLLRFDDIAN